MTSFHKNGTVRSNLNLDFDMMEHALKYKAKEAGEVFRRKYRSTGIETDNPIHLRDMNVLESLFSMKQSRIFYSQCMNEFRSNVRTVL